MYILVKFYYAQIVRDGASSHKIYYVTGCSKSQKASKLHDWFNSYSNIAEKYILPCIYFWRVVFLPTSKGLGPNDQLQYDSLQESDDGKFF